jgi:hypothetical protein
MNKLYASAIISLFSFSALAQNNLGVATGNYSGTQGLFLNPANIAGNSEKIVIDIATVVSGLDNNLGSLNTSGLVSKISNGDLSDVFHYTNRGKFSMLAPYADVRGPGAMVNFHGKHSLALTTRLRGIQQFHNFDRSLYEAINTPGFWTGGNIDLTSKDFNYTAHIWSEVGLSYGVVLLDAEDSRVKAGITLRYLGGRGYGSLKGVNLDAHFRTGNDSFYAENSDIEYASNVFTPQNALTNGFLKNSILSEFFGPKAAAGWGGDIGLVYEYIGSNCPADRNYRLRLSASVIDIGSIKYKKENNFNAVITGNGYITGQDIIDNVTNYQDFRNYAVQQGFTADTTKKDVRLYMPSRLMLGADYNIQGHYYVNATFIGNLAYRGNFGNSYYNQFTVTPRYDTRLLSIGLPITYNTLAPQTIRVGLGVRFSGFFIGSDDMLALVSNHQYGFNFYVGGFVPLQLHKGLASKGHSHDEGSDEDAGRNQDDTDRDMDKGEDAGKADSSDNSLNYKMGMLDSYAKISAAKGTRQSHENENIPAAAIAPKSEFIGQRH